MQKKPLTEVLNELEQEMLRLGYTEGSMKFYRRRWGKAPVSYNPTGRQAILSLEITSKKKLVISNLCVPSYGISPAFGVCSN